MASVEPIVTEPVSPPALGGEVEGRTPWQLFWFRFRQDRLAIAGGIFILVLVVLALLAPTIASSVAHHGPNETFQATMTDDFGLPKGPNSAFLFGADKLGRDVFVRVIYGIRTSLTIAILATGLAVVIGVVVGVIAGFFRGVVDTVVSRIIDIVLSMPLLLFAIGISAACQTSREGCLNGLVKPGLALIIFVIGIFSWTYIARIIRGQVLSLREREFIDASRSLGAGNIRIMFKEVLPNLVAPIIVYSTLIIPSNILFEAYLSYLGIGIPPTTPSWGRMISDAAGLYERAWWLMVYPGMFLLMTTLAFNLLGDGLRDAFDPKTER